MLRRFRLSDQAQVRELVLAGLAERWGPAFDAAMNPDLEDITSTYADARIIVAEIEDRIVATGMLIHEEPDHGRIVRMSVDRIVRRQGLGRRIVEQLISEARSCGMTELRVLTDTPWTSEVELYRSCGFTEIGNDDTDTFFALQL